MIEIKERFEDYTEAEFLALVSEFFRPEAHEIEDEQGNYVERLVFHFISITEHPAGTDVLCNPGEGEEDSPEGVLKRVKEWRAQNGKPGFKQV